MIYCHALLILSVVQGGEGETSQPYNPTDVFLISCGAITDEYDSTGRKWKAENSDILPPDSVYASFYSHASSKRLLPPQVPYMSARIFRSDFTYTFPVTTGWKFLRLYFFPTHYGSDFDAVNSFFSVKTNSYTLLNNFSADLTANASKPESKYLIKEFLVPVHKLLTLTFLPSPNSLAFVNGIEIVSMPDRFYTNGGFDDVITNVGSNVDFSINNTTAFETVYRLNVGGHDVYGDTGMSRRWLSDDEFIVGENSGIEPETVKGVTVNYTEKTPAYVAPEDVYKTSRSMGNIYNPKLNLNLNLTWLFMVDAGFNYLVRLHFCETLPDLTREGQRVFSIFIDQQMAKHVTDVIYLSGGSRKPMYLDFSVYVGYESRQSRDLRLDLHPFNEGFPKYFNAIFYSHNRYDAILNGVEILKLSDSGGNLARYSSKPRMMGGKLHVLKIMLVAVGSAIGLVLIILVLVLLMRHIKRKKNRETNNVAMFKVLLKHYTYAEVKKITKSFSHTIGKGGFGTVYGGNLCNGRKVAVKVLNVSKGNGEDFINEVASMSQTSHVNIVSLLGFCYEGSKRAIVYEFLENGSLDQFISRKKPLTMDITTLYGIALGVARGLEYLHYGCKTRIVHFDIKPQNILLDGNLCPKVSDFGLAKLCEKRESIVSLMDTRGTIGYIAPEVFSRMYGGISHKSDVYSYGMLVLEMIGARNKDMVETKSPDLSSSYFPDWIYKDLENGEQTWLHADEITKEEKEIAQKMILVSLWCIQPCPNDRPPMNRAVEMIEGSLDALEIPPKPSMNISARLTLECSSLFDGIKDEENSSNI